MSSPDHFSHSSQLIQSRKADIFIWWPSTPVAEMVACINSSVTGPVTAETLLRWVNMLAALGGPGVMEVRKALVRRIAVLQYYPGPLDAVLPSTLLTPGDYGCYYTVKDYLARGRPLNPSYGPMGRTLTDIKHKLESEATLYPSGGASEALERYTIPEPFREQVSNRDGIQCIFTGPVSTEAKQALDIFWLFPPGLFRYATTKATNRYIYKTTDFQVPENLMTMRRDIYELWHSNAFCVDVDDGFRIYIFNEKAKEIGLPPKLNNIPTGEESNLFFREHLKATLVAHFMGGDVQWDYDSRAVDRLVEELGLDARSGPEDGQTIDFLDERLQSGIGRAILEHYLSRQLEPSSAHQRLDEHEASVDSHLEGSYDDNVEGYCSDERD